MRGGNYIIRRLNLKVNESEHNLYKTKCKPEEKKSRLILVKRAALLIINSRNIESIKKKPKFF